MIEVVAKEYQKTIVALGEAVKFIEKNPCSPSVEFYKKHVAKLCSLLENLKVVNIQSSSEQLVSANQVYEFMRA